MIVSRLEELSFDDVFVELEGFAPGRRVILKLENYQPTGSIKFKTARQILDTLEQSGQLSGGDMVVESSSGNLGVALALLCARRGYRFTCVIDPNTQETNARLIQAHGGQLSMVTQRDAGGYLKARLERVAQLLAQNTGAVWTNQYANAANAAAHEQHTAPAILRNVPGLNTLVIGAGTTGTLLGCMRHIYQAAPGVRVVAVDSVGSVTFGGAPSPRKLPGIGTAVRPALADQVDAIQRPMLHMVEEPDTVRMCHRLLRQHGLLLGASTGTVLCGLEIEAKRAPAGSTLVAISPDGGERYLDTLYNDEWLAKTWPQHFGQANLEAQALNASHVRSPIVEAA
jgi:2,3-diaminopropionate biosynthesis protein SbnA